MENEPLISIITVSYNSEKTIKDTIESLLNQTYKNIEYILVDGKSTDSTVNIIKSYEKTAKKKGIIYRWVSELDKGIYDAMNKGISMASGEVIGIINSDDWYESKAIESVIKVFEENKSIDVVHGNLLFYTRSTGNKLERKPKEIEKLRQEMCLYHPSIFVRSKVYNDLDGFNLEYKIASDYEFILKCYLNKKKFFYLNKVLAVYDNGGATGDNILSSWKEVKKIQDRIYGKSIINYFYYSIKIIKRMILTIFRSVKS